MNCRTFKELVPALALDALDEGERSVCAAHLSESGPHDGCVQAESDARALAARLASALPGHRSTRASGAASKIARRRSWRRAAPNLKPTTTVRRRAGAIRPAGASRSFCWASTSPGTLSGLPRLPHRPPRIPAPVAGQRPRRGARLTIRSAPEARSPRPL